MKTKLLLIIILMQSLIAAAQPGAIDLSFNPSGVGAYGGTLPPSYDATADGIVYRSSIYTSGTHRNKIIIAGRFTSFNGVARRYIARLTSNGAVDTSFNGPALTGYIYCVEILSNDKLIVTGSFTITSGATTIKNIARLNADGSLDDTFNPLPTGTRGGNDVIHALAIQDNGKILIGGNFTQYNGASSRRVIRLNSDGTVDATFNGTGTVNGEVRTLAIQKLGTNAGKIIVGGFFSGFTGRTIHKIIRLLPNGDYDTTFNVGGTGATGGDAIFDISIRNDDQMYVAGKFTQFNGLNKRSIVMLNQNGSLVTTFNAGGIGITSAESNAGLGSGYNVFSLKQQPDGELLIGGNFTEYNGTTLPKGLARLNPDGSLDTNFLTGTGFTGGTNVYMGKSVIRDIILQIDGKIIVGGDFTDYDNTPRRMLARIKTRNCALTAVYSSGNGWDGGVMPTDDNYHTVIQSGTCTIPSGTDLVACELHVAAGATLIIESNASITVKGVVITNGTFRVEDSGSLVQVTDNVVNSGNGSFTLKRNTTPVTRYDFTYWSSPVLEPTLFNVSPNTLYDKYFKFNTAINNWEVINYGIETMTVGRGYIIRAPQNFSTTVPSIYTAIFTGKPHNGRIYTPIVKSGSNNMNLIGNPYPSAIDADAFLNYPGNSGLVGGTIYLWTHKSPTTASGSYYVYSSNDYATYNKVGGVTTQPGSVAPFSGKIASGQAFFVEGLGNANATFSNTMRVTNQNTQFYRLAAPAKKNRIWLNITNAQGAFNQTLLGYIEGATNGIDRDFDGKILSGNFVSLYSICENQNLTIQGRPTPFNASDKIQLGYKATISGKFEIAIANVEGVLAKQNVYLEDKLLKIVHLLSQSPYGFESKVGTFNDRFVLRYDITPAIRAGKKNIETTDDSASKPTVIVKTANSAIALLAKNSNIKAVQVFDTPGNKIFEKNGLDQPEFVVEGIKNNQILMVRITLQDDTEIMKKIGY